MMNYRGLTYAIFAGAFVFGIVMASLGALLPALVRSIGFEKADAGTLFLVMNFGMLLGSLVFGPICDRFGFRLLLVISTLMIGGAFLSLSQASSYLTLLLTLPVLGLGGGGLNGAANALLNDISADRRNRALNLLGIYFGIGALLTPFVIGVLLGNLGLSAILLGFAIFSTAPVLLFLLAQFPAPKHEGGLSWNDCARMLSKPILLLFGLVLFFQSGNEFAIGGWASTYLGERFAMNADNCAYALAGYWLALMLGRWIASRLGSRISPPGLVLYSSSIALLACAGLILAPNSIAAVVLVATVGFGFAAIFPAVLAQAGEAFAGYSGTAFSVIFVMALTGGMTTPWLVGNIAQIQGVGAGLWVVVFNCAAIFFLQGFVRRRHAIGAGIRR